DGDDDPARAHVRGADGRRRSREREAARACALERRACERPAGGRRRRGARRAPRRRRPGDGARAARTCERLGAGGADMRLDVEAAVVRGELVQGDVEVEGGVVVEVGLAGGTPGRIAVPGFVDLQVNGFGGIDFLSATRADYETAGAALLESGVTAFQPTFITAPESVLVDALRA